MLGGRVAKMASLKGGRMKPAYCYAPDTGEFTAGITAQPSPLEPGNYLLPASATFDPPPKPGTHEAAVFRDGKWATVPDWRGIDLFSKADGERTKIEELGLTPDDAGLTDKPRPGSAHCWKKGKWAEDAAAKAALLEESRAQCRTAIKAERDRRKAGGVLSGEKWFHSDADSRMQHLQLKDAARARPASSPATPRPSACAWCSCAASSASTGARAGGGSARPRTGMPRTWRARPRSCRRPSA
jgi:hypothetical protein